MSAHDAYVRAKARSMTHAMAAVFARIGRTPDIDQMVSPAPSSPRSHDRCRIPYKIRGAGRFGVSEVQCSRLGLAVWGRWASGDTSSVGPASMFPAIPDPLAQEVGRGLPIFLGALQPPSGAHSCSDLLF